MQNFKKIKKKEKKVFDSADYMQKKGPPHAQGASLGQAAIPAPKPIWFKKIEK